MRANLETILRLCTNNEGGYSNHPKDPGGPTNHGITQGTLSTALKRPASVAEVKALTLAAANLIYEKMYWRPIQGDRLPAGLDYAVFDFGVNSGPSRAVKELQRLLPGVGIDGIIGDKTIEAIEGMDLRKLIKDYCNARLAFCKKLKNWKDFGRGWTYRIIGIDPLKKYAVKPGVVGDALKFVRGDTIKVPAATMSNNAINLETSALPPMAKARDSDVGLLAPLRNKVQLGAIVSSAVAGVSQYVAPLQGFAGVIEPYKDDLRFIGYVFVGVSIVCGVIVFAQNIDKIRESGTHA